MNWFLYALGTVGAVLFATACVPMAWKTFKLGRDIGTPLSTIWTFVLATLLFGIYLVGTIGLNVPTGMVVIEFFCWSLALWYHYFPRPDWTKLFEFETVCTRPNHVESPCNGLPRVDCPGYAEWARREWQRGLRFARAGDRNGAESATSSRT